MREIVVTEPRDRRERIEKRAAPPNECGGPCCRRAVCGEYDHWNKAARYGIGKTVELYAECGLEARAIKLPGEEPIERVSNNGNGHERSRSAMIGSHGEVCGTATCQQRYVGQQVAHMDRADWSSGYYVSPRVAHVDGAGWSSRFYGNGFDVRAQVVHEKCGKRW